MGGRYFNEYLNESVIKKHNFNPQVVEMVLTRKTQLIRFAFSYPLEKQLFKPWCYCNFTKKLETYHVSIRNKTLTLSWRRSLSYKNHSIDLLCKSVDWFLYDNGLRQERVKHFIPSHFKALLLQTHQNKHFVKIIWLNFQCSCCCKFMRKFRRTQQIYFY